MKIVADENIPLLDTFFKDLSTQLMPLAGRNISAEDVKDADVLLVRSITKVSPELLQGSSVKFVGTCTIGTDHIDLDYLKSHNIGFSSAPGCNARAVVDYVLSAMLCITEKTQKPFRDLSVGIVGAGNVGSRLYEVLDDLGVKVCAYDPNIEKFASGECAEKVWQQDVVTLHVPISHDGPHKTHHLVDAKRLASMNPEASLINSCRGLVVNNQDLLVHLKSTPAFNAVMDVWEQEPSPGDELMKVCLLATPHIAGYSLDGKYNGTYMIYKALCDFLALPKRLKLAQLIDEPALRKVSFSRDSESRYQLQKIIRNVYDIRDDHFRMLSLLGLNDEDKAKGFDALRKNYPYRRDGVCLTVSGRGLDEAGIGALKVKHKD